MALELMMNRILVAYAAATALPGGAFAADPVVTNTPPAPARVSNDGFDFAFGAKIMNDYIFRSVTQTNHKPAGTIYFEPRYTIGDTQVYAGVQPWTVRLTTKPAAEVDLYAGVRQNWAAFAYDMGLIYYLYPNNKDQYWTNGTPGAPTPFDVTVLNPLPGPALCPAGGLCATTPRNPSYLELYLRPSYNVTELFNAGATLYWARNWGKSQLQAAFISATAKYTFGRSGFSVSGEFGRMLLGALKPGTITNAGPASFDLPNYNSWNIGVSYAWNAFTADLRYHGSDLSKTSCYVVSADPAGNPPGVGGYTGWSKWCGQRFMATLSVDFTYLKHIRKQ